MAQHSFGIGRNRGCDCCVNDGYGEAIVLGDGSNYISIVGSFTLIVASDIPSS